MSKIRKTHGDWNTTHYKWIKDFKLSLQEWYQAIFLREPWVHLPTAATLTALSTCQREVSAILDQKRGKGRFSFLHNPLYATWAKKRQWEEGLCSWVGILSLQESLWAQGTCPTFLACSSDQQRAQIPALKGLMLEPGVAWFPKLGQQKNPVKTNVMRILLENKIIGKIQ